jgi:hypothetical protein
MGSTTTTTTWSNPRRILRVDDRGSHFIVYACKGFYGIDGKTGEVKWADKDVKGEFTQVSDDLLIVRKKDKVRGYSLK